MRCKGAATTEAEATLGPAWPPFVKGVALGAGSSLMFAPKASSCLLHETGRDRTKSSGKLVVAAAASMRSKYGESKKVTTERVGHDEAS